MKKKCLTCQRWFILINKRQKYCSLKCRSKDYYIKYYKHFKWKKDKYCPVCKKLFVTISYNQICCSSKCRVKKWRINNREKDLQQRREYNYKRKLDPIKHQKDLDVRKKWRAKNKDKKYSYKRRYRALKYGSGGKHTKEEWEEKKKEYNYICPRCRKNELQIILTEDHIVPITKKGTDNIDNIQPLCKVCNSIKGDKIIRYKPIPHCLFKISSE